MATSGSGDPIEVVYVQFEAALDNYFEQLDRAMAKTERVIKDSTKRQKQEKFEPFDFTAFDNYMPTLRRRLAGFIGDMNKAKEAERQAAEQAKKSGSLWEKLKNAITGARGSLGKIGGQAKGVKDYMTGLADEGGRVVQTFLSFARGKAPISAVTAQLGRLGAALGPVGAIAAVTIGAVVAGVNELRQRVMAATGDILNMIQTVDTAGVTAGTMFEKFTVQFETLLGSTDAARERIAEYAEFGASTPFELPQVVRAGKLLQTFGGDMIATGDTLTMVGDMAATAGVGFEEIAMWVGRAYTAIQSGRPFGEAAARLQELGLMSGPARQAMEDMQKQGATADEMWAKFTETMGEFNGMMDKQSKTMEGMRSNLEDYREQIALAGGRSFFEEEKRNLQEYLAFLEGGSPFEEAAGRIEEMRDALDTGDMLAFQNVVDRMVDIGMLTDENRRKIVEMAQDGAGSVEILASNIFELNNGLQGTAGDVKAGVDQIDKFKKSLETQQIVPFESSVEQMVKLGVITQETADEVRKLREEGASIPIILDAAGLETNKDKIKDIADLTGQIKTDFQNFMNVWKQNLLNAINLDSIQDMMESFRELSAQFITLRRVLGEEDLATDIGNLIDVFVDFVDWVVTGAAKITLTLTQISIVGRALGKAWEAILTGMSLTIIAFADQFKGKSLWDILTGGVDFELPDLSAVIGAAEQAFADEMNRGTRIMDEQIRLRDKYNKSIEKNTNLLDDNTVANEEANDAMELNQQRIAAAEQYYDELLEIQRNSNEQRDRLNQEYAQRELELQQELAERMNAAADKRMDAIMELEADMAEERQKLTEDTEKKRDEINAKYQQKADEKREDAHRQELREEEDHQREMDRLRRRYLDDLEDAVANRDARAIRDLRDRYQEEKSQAEENFNLEQTRKDQDARLEEQRAEQAKQRELDRLDEQEREKAALLDQKEEERRAKIEETFQLEQARAQEQYQEALAAEQQQLAEQQAQLDQALATKLESIAKAMANDKEVTEEGARAVLSALNEVFGAGGDIDKMMEDFANRRRTKMEVQISVEKIFSAPAETAGRSADAERYAAQADYYNSQSRGRTDTGTGGVGRAMATGGLLLANRPTLVQVGEEEPELLSVSPVSALGSLSRQAGLGGGGMAGEGEAPQQIEIEFKGSAPPGIGLSERDQIAGTLVGAMRQAGWLVQQKHGS